MRMKITLSELPQNSMSERAVGVSNVDQKWICAHDPVWSGAFMSHSQRGHCHYKNKQRSQ